VESARLTILIDGAGKHREGYSDESVYFKANIESVPEETVTGIIITF